MARPLSRADVGASGKGAAARPTRSPDEGVSNVLGAVMLFGIFVVMLLVIQTEFVPVWDEQREASHMDTVAGQMAQAKSDMDRQVDNRTDVPISSPVKMQRSAGFRFFGGEANAGEMEFVPAATGTGVTVSSPRLTVLQDGSQTFYGLAAPDDWETIDNVDDTRSGITNMRALRFRVDLSDPGGYNDGDASTLTITDAGGLAGKATVTYLNLGGSERGLHTQVYNEADQEVSSDMESFFHNTDLGFFYVDLLDDNLLFDAVIAAAEAPLTLTITDQGLGATYVIVYDEVGVGGGTTTVGATGLVVQPYAPAPYESGVLRFSASNGNFVDQTYVMEHGALMRVQGVTAVMLVEPQLNIVAGADTLIEWTVPTMTGAGHGVSGSASASILSDPTGGRVDLRATASTLTFSIPTAYPDTWQAFLDRQLRLAGLSSADGDYTITPAASSVAVTVLGADHGSVLEDIFLVFRQAAIHVELRASG